MVATATGLTVLGILVGPIGLPAGWANVVATAMGTVPSFELNRRWVWGQGGRRSVAGEVLPFVAMSFAGLAVSTWTVDLASRWADYHAVGGGTRTALVEVAHLAGFGAVWLVQFVLLDRVLFRRARTATAERA
jgi:putative flippase GtrA